MRRLNRPFHAETVVAIAAAFLVSAILFPQQAQADTIDLDFQTGFSNGTTVINVGDTIRWTWTDFAPHSVISIGGGFTSSEVLVGLGESYEVTFDTAGEFPYICGVHGASMGGTISVVDSAPVPLLSPPILFGLPLVMGAVSLSCLGRRKRDEGSA